LPALLLLESEDELSSLPLSEVVAEIFFEVEAQAL
jgi:hypothetical protein